MHFAQQNTLQNTLNFLLHTCLVTFFVALKPTSIRQYITVCICCGSLRNTHQYTALHHTPCILLALSLYPSCKTGATVHSGGMKWPIIAEIYLELDNFLSMAAGWPVGDGDKLNSQHFE
jgi:hypothetical protein